MLLYLLKVLLHMEQENCIGPTRICAGVGIQNLLSLLKEHPLKLFLSPTTSSLMPLFSTSEISSAFGNPMCKATVTFSIFSSLTPRLISWALVVSSSSFNGFLSVKPLRRGRHWILPPLMGSENWFSNCSVVKEEEEEE